jgi:hypothetical protein
MRRLIIPLAAAALVAACYDAPSTPTASLQTPGPARLDAIPPPPPASGEGFGDFTAFEATDASETTCSVHDTFTFAYEYFDSGTDNNAYLHIRVDGNGLDVAVHETTKKITANGTLTRPGFTFQINDVVDGTIFNKEPGVPDRVSLSLTGQLTLTDGTTCVANATLTAQLTKVDTTGDVLPPPQ